MSGFGSPSAFGAPSLSAPVAQPTTRPASPFSPSLATPSPFGQPNPFGAFAAASTPASQPARQKSPFEQSNPTSSPFATQTNGSVFGSSAFGGQTAPSTTANPFATPSTATSTNTPASFNPFAPKPTEASTNPFAKPVQQSSANRSVSPFSVPSSSTNGAPNPFAQVTGNDRKRKEAFPEKNSSKPQGHDLSQRQASQSSGFGAKPKMGSSFASFTDRATNKTEPPQAITPSTSNGFGKPKSNYAQAIHDRLQRDGIKAPRWPAEPGNPAKRKAMEDFKDTYKQYLSRVRTSLIKAGLVDDPDVRKTLSEAIDFKGICEEMCPEFEKISRITEYDVKRQEKMKQPDGVEWAIPDRMVKAFKRSAAGADAPLPMEVRSPAALRRTVDYLVDNLLRSDDRLPALHNFLWDRTRAVRKDFIFQNAMTTEERLDQIYCLETIARFHAVALHLLSQEGVAADDFSEQQEREQLGKTLLSLMQVYDESKDHGLVIKNEAEFRAYYLLFNAHDPFVKQQLQDWGREIWFDSDEIQTAVSLMESMQSVFRHRGPLRPPAPLTTTANSFTNYFSIVEDPKVSYTMACFAEIHFSEIRRHLLKTLNKAYGRIRDHPKDLTAEAVNKILRFDDTSQCIAFLEQHDMEFSPDTNPPYLLVERRKHVPSPTVKQSHSAQMVERKRGHHSLPEVIHSTVFENLCLPNDQGDSPDGMFLPSEPPAATGPSQADQSDYDVTDEESSSSSPSKPSVFTPATTAPAAASPFLNGLPQSANTTQPAPIVNPFGSAPIYTQPNPEKSSPFQHSSGLSWPSKPAETPLQSTTPSLFNPPKVPETSPFTKPAAVESLSTTNVPGPFSFLGKETDSARQPASTAIEKPADQPSNFSGSFKPQAEQPQAPNITFTPPASSPGSHVGQPVSTTSTTASEGFKAKPFQPVQTTSFAFPPTNAARFPQAPILGQDSSSTPSSPSISLAPDASKTPDGTKSAFLPIPEVPVQPPQPKDPMGDFTKWIVLGDDGLIDQFQDAMVEHLVKGVFDKYQAEEEERKKKEEDEQSWADALKFRRYNLGLKFFYRWRDITRSLVRKRIGRQNREVMKAYRDAQVAEAKAAKAAREKSKRKATEDAGRSVKDTSALVQQMRDRAHKRARTASSQRDSSTDSVERALLSSGVFAGISNEREAIARVSRRESFPLSPPNPFASSTSAAGFAIPATKAKDPLRSVTAGVSKSVAKPKESAKKRWLRDIASGKHTDGSINGLLTHKYANSLSQSLPPGTKITNFTKYQTSSPRSSIGPESLHSKQSNGPKTEYWRLKTRGLVVMPDGRALHESLALPMMHDGVRYPGIGDYGLGPGKRQSIEQTPEFDEWSPPSSTTKTNALRRSSPGPQENVTGSVVDGTKADGGEGYLPPDVERTLAEFKALAAEMDEGTKWFREQNDIMLSGQSPFSQHQ